MKCSCDHRSTPLTCYPWGCWLQDQQRWSAHDMGERRDEYLIYYSELVDFDHRVKVHEVTSELLYCRSQSAYTWNRPSSAWFPYLLPTNLPSTILLRFLFSGFTKWQSKTEQWYVGCGYQNKPSFWPPIVQRSRNVVLPNPAGFRTGQPVLIRSLFCGRCHNIDVHSVDSRSQSFLSWKWPSTRPCSSVGLFFIERCVRCFLFFRRRVRT